MSAQQRLSPKSSMASSGKNLAGNSSAAFGGDEEEGHGPIATMTHAAPVANVKSILDDEGTRKALAAGAIMVTLVLYGVVQERIMTQPYGPNNDLYFKNAAYLVLNNRIIAMLIAVAMMYRNGESMKNVAPIPNFFGISFSNTLSTMCQYEALKYVSFPTQTLGKCGKMIPVMVLGMLVSGKKYVMLDYIVASVVTAGCAMFVLTGETSANAKADSGYGFILMGGYLFSDAFTSTFQEKLFRGYKMSTYNQMLYVNMCSAILSVIALIWEGDLMTGITFSIENPDFLVNSLMLSFAASLGQMAIYYTIKNFGALFFATVMTVRQVISIVVSCVIYLHPLSWGQIASAGVVFAILYWKDTQKGHSHGHGHGSSSSSSSSSASSASSSSSSALDKSHDDAEKGELPK